MRRQKTYPIFSMSGLPSMLTTARDLSAIFAVSSWELDGSLMVTQALKIPNPTADSLYSRACVAVTGSSRAAIGERGAWTHNALPRPTPFLRNST